VLLCYKRLLFVEEWQLRQVLKAVELHLNVFLQEPGGGGVRDYSLEEGRMPVR
jgi:hypothetical protein